ncbi:alpha/beta fold hydrolase [Roseomonas sp. SSH11]|uniref:Alpha/beta fold hydrolase n=1 Tax=Pararoseomonas baculiformis TaxID=2820812 RepID=A0ABS4AC55_9PROT|nr:alpha/beta fold hydrolase [Pararoseomonas baculiformis]MBP0444584.1 alpha/beta fold hydrolase [Pararoseomonas baculiformis]
MQTTAHEDRLGRLAAIATRAQTPHGGGRLVWHEWGAGRPAVLLHGGAGSWRHWARNIEPLAARRHVLVPDLPGLGESDMPPQGITLWGLAAIIAEGIAARLGPGTPYDLVGFSFGAITAGHIAARHGAGVESLTLLGAGALGLPREEVPLVSVRDRQGESRAAAHRENLRRLMIADPARIDAEALAIQAWNSDHARFRSRSITSPTSLRDALAEVQAPLSVIYGERDAIVVPHMADRLAFFRARGVEPLLIPGAGHWVAFEAAEAVNRALLPAP